VNGQVQQPLRIDSVDFTGGTSSLLHLRFTATAGQTYTVQYRDSLMIGNWFKLTDVPNQWATQQIEITDASMTNSTTRYYRIVTPQQP
jgi:hypothetical protein